MFNLGTTIRWFFDILFGFIFEREKISAERLLGIHESSQGLRAYSKREVLPFIYCLPYSDQYVRTSMWSYKFRNNKSLSKLFGNIVSQEISKQKYDWDHTGFNLPILITVPSSKESNTNRGYDSNHEMAQFVSRMTDIPYFPHALSKKSGVSKQSRMKNREDRLKNPQGAFTLRKPQVVTNKNIILLDDVLTTGATVREIVRILHLAGAQKVQVLVIAH